MTLFSMLDTILVLLIGFDILSLRRVHRATLVGVLFLVAMQFSKIPLRHSAHWHHFTSWVQGL